MQNHFLEDLYKIFPKFQLSVTCAGYNPLYALNIQHHRILSCRHEKEDLHSIYPGRTFIKKVVTFLHAL